MINSFRRFYSLCMMMTFKSASDVDKTTLKFSIVLHHALKVILPNLKAEIVNATSRSNVRQHRTSSYRHRNSCGRNRTHIATRQRTSWQPWQHTGGMQSKVRFHNDNMTNTKQNAINETRTHKRLTPRTWRRHPDERKENEHLHRSTACPTNSSNK